MSNETLILDTPDQIEAFRRLALYHALRLECVGMKRRGPSAFSIIKREFGLKGSKEAVLASFGALIGKTPALHFTA